MVLGEGQVQDSGGRSTGFDPYLHLVFSLEQDPTLSIGEAVALSNMTEKLLTWTLTHSN